MIYINIKLYTLQFFKLFQLVKLNYQEIGNKIVQRFILDKGKLLKLPLAKINKMY